MCLELVLLEFREIAVDILDKLEGGLPLPPMLLEGCVIGLLVASIFSVKVLYIWCLQHGLPLCFLFLSFFFF